MPKEVERKKGPVFTDLHWVFKICKLFGTIAACLCSTELFDVASFQEISLIVLPGICIPWGKPNL